MKTYQDILSEFERLDKITGLNARNIPVFMNNSIILNETALGFTEIQDGEVKAFFFSPLVLQDKYFRTVWHEYAHYMVLAMGQHEENKHGPLFREACEKIGFHYTRDSISVSDIQRENGDFLVKCFTCNSIVSFSELAYTKEKRKFICPNCGGTMFMDIDFEKEY